MIPTIPPTADELLAEIDRARAAGDFCAESEASWAEIPEPSWLQILAVWTVVFLGLLACLSLWFVGLTAVARVFRHLVAS